MNYFLTKLTKITALFFLLISASFAAYAAPANDNLADAQTINFNGDTVTINSNNTGATREAGEPAHYHSSIPGAESVWYKFQAASDLSVQLELTENFDSIIAVYEASSMNPTFGNLSRITYSSDALGYDGVLTHVRFRARTSKVYFIAVDCPRADTAHPEGNFQLKIMRNRLRYSAKYLDFGDRASVSLFRPSDGIWYSIPNVRNAGSPYYLAWGKSGDTPVPADFDGDGVTDFAVTRDVGGAKMWYIRPSNINEAPIYQQWGLATDAPAVGDYDRDGIADIAVIRAAPTGLTWYVRQSSTGALRVFNFGANGDEPVFGDFDGDGATDVSVKRINNGIATWYSLLSGFDSMPNSTYTQIRATQFGEIFDAQAVADYDGDGKSDLAYFRTSNGTWKIQRSSDNQIETIQLGTFGDVPQPADYDGDGKASVAVYRPSNGTWYLSIDPTTNYGALRWGAATDIPVTTLHVLFD